MPHKSRAAARRTRAAGADRSSDTLLEAQAIAAALAELGYATTTLPVGLDLGALQRALRDARAPCRRQSRGVARGPRELRPRRAGLARGARRAVHGLLGAGARRHVEQARSRSELHAARRGADARRRSIGDGRRRRPVDREVGLRARVARPRRLLGRRGAARSSGVLEARRAEFGGRWFAERFVPGRELNVALIAAPDGPRVLPVAEIRFDGFPPDKPRDRRLRGQVARRQLRVPQHGAQFARRADARGARRRARARLLGAVRARRLRARRLSRRRGGHAVGARGQRQSVPVARRRFRGGARARPASPIVDAVGWLIADARRRARDGRAA